MISRRTLIAASAIAFATPTLGATSPKLTVYKTASCTCCGGWVQAMTKAGYAPEVVVIENVTPVAAKHGVPFALSSCHLATIGGYVTVGHVPPGDVDRLLREKPKALGLTVPGMPMGSPGMEMPNGAKEAFDTLLLLPGGKTQVFARHA